MNKHVVNLFVPTLVVLWSLAYWAEIADIGARDKLLIRPVCILLCLIYCYLLWIEYKSYRLESTSGDSASGIRDKKNFWQILPKKEITIIALLATYLLIVPWLGFVVTSFIFMICMLYLLDVRKIHVIVGFSVISTGVLYLAFKVILMIPLPGGIFGF